jgi:hypothetical protein
MILENLSPGILIICYIYHSLIKYALPLVGNIFVCVCKISVKPAMQYCSETRSIGSQGNKKVIQAVEMVTSKLYTHDQIKNKKY